MQSMLARTRGRHHGAASTHRGYVNIHHRYRPSTTFLDRRESHGQDQDRQAGHDGGDRPRRPGHPSLGHQVVGDLPGHAEREGADRRPLGEPAGPAADRLVAGQPGAQRVRRIGLDADRQGDRGVQVQRRPDTRQRGHQPEPGHLRDGDPPGPHLGRRRGGQDQQRPGPYGPARPGRRRGPVRGGWSAGPRRDRSTQTVVRSAGRAGSHGSHACHHPSAVASG